MRLLSTLLLAGFVACAAVTEARAIARDSAGTTLATTGSIRFEPDGINVIPRLATFTVDLRDPNEQRLQSAERRLADFLAEIAERVSPEGHILTPLDEDIARAALQAAGHAQQLSITLGSVCDSPARRNAAAANARQRQAQEIVLSDPLVQALQRDYDGKIVPGSIQPL